MKVLGLVISSLVVFFSANYVKAQALFVPDNVIKKFTYEQSPAPTLTFTPTPTPKIKKNHGKKVEESLDHYSLDEPRAAVDDTRNIGLSILQKVVVSGTNNNGSIYAELLSDSVFNDFGVWSLSTVVSSGSDAVTANQDKFLLGGGNIVNSIFVPIKGWGDPNSGYLLFSVLPKLAVGDVTNSANQPLNQTDVDLDCSLLLNASVGSDHGVVKLLFTGSYSPFAGGTPQFYSDLGVENKIFSYGQMSIGLLFQGIGSVNFNVPLVGPSGMNEIATISINPITTTPNK